MQSNASLNETEAEEFGFSPEIADEAAPPEDSSGTTEEGKKSQPESSHPPPSGNATNAARALKEMQGHRALLHSGLQELLSVTKNGFEALSIRLGRLEQGTGITRGKKEGANGKAIDKKTINSVEDGGSSLQSILLDALPGGGDEGGALPEEYEQIDEGESKEIKETKEINLKSGKARSDANLKGRRGSKFATLRKQMVEQRKQQMEEAGFIGDPAEFEALGGVEIVHKSSDGSITVSKADDPAIADGLPTPIGNTTDAVMPPQRGRTAPQSSSSILPGKGKQQVLPVAKAGNSAASLGSPVRAFRGVDWSLVEGVTTRGDHVTAFVEVLDRGSLQDMMKLMEITGPKPEILSVGVRNRVLDSIATLLHQNGGGSANAGANIERCLIWLLALIRSKENLASCIVPHTKRDICESLKVAALDNSKRGMLASLLATQLERCV